MRTVLLVLQSDSFRIAVQEALQEHYHVITTQYSISGADLLHEQPDILILDLFLSGTNGLRFLRENYSLLPQTVLLFTPLANPRVIYAAANLGVSALFMKPCSLSAVLKWLESQT